MTLLGDLRSPLKRIGLALLRKLALLAETRKIAAQMMDGLLDWRPGIELRDLAGDRPYPELGEAAPESSAARRDDVIMITARFRSGSTLLWNLFRHVKECTAYYEPLHPRLAWPPEKRRRPISQSHRNVTDYWVEYDPIADLQNCYLPRFHSQRLYMDERVWDPELKKYVELLIDRAPGRPVLQFNRIDFRLAWFRLHFPRARFIHMYRNPRDQWISVLRNPAAVPRTASLKEFSANDHFFLGEWVEDLQYHFPFLAWQHGAHPYGAFYLIWKLSYLFGRKYAHYSFPFENLLNQPEAQLSELMEAAGVENYDRQELRGLIVEPARDRWKEYAPADWFESHEASCEAVLRDFLSLSKASGLEKQCDKTGRHSQNGCDTVPAKIS